MLIYKSMVLLRAGLLLAIAFSFVFQAEASSITWGSATNITGDSNVSTGGTLVGAFNIGGPGVGSTTVNGVMFAPFALSGTTSTSGNFTFAMPTSSVSTNSAGSG